MAEIRIPQFGPGITEVVILEWLKSPGELVAAGEAVVEIETDKTTTELPSPADGRLGEPHYDVGQTVPVFSVIAEIIEG